MENRIEFEIDWKQKAREKFTLGTKRLFRIVGNIHCKINHLELTTRSPAHSTAEILKDYEIKAEQKKAEGIELVRRKLTT